MNNNLDKIKITYNDIEKVVLTSSTWSNSSSTSQQQSTVNRQWGSIQDITGAGTGIENSKTSIIHKSWFYLSVAGLIAALIAWAICEPGFSDTSHNTWGNSLLFPLMAAFVSAALIVSEMISEHSYQKAISRGFISLLIGLGLGAIFVVVGGLLYMTFLEMIASGGGQIKASNPFVWISRATAWMFFGVSSGVIYGLISQSKKKCIYGIIGGAVGSGLGGLFFDPISLLTNGGTLSRCIGMMFYGASTGLAISLVESALKDRWLYVSNGPLAGKQFILYKLITRLGSNQSNDIFLFKDDTIAPAHATIELMGPSTIITPYAPVYISNQPIQSPRKLKNGETIQIGKYTFNYQEKNPTK